MHPDYHLTPGWTAADVRRWLLTWLSGSASELPGMPSRVTRAVAVQAIFIAEEPDRREVLKEGIVLAIQEWRGQPHGFEALADLAQAAGVVGASAAVGVLGAVVEREFDRGFSDRRSRALSAAIATITGFAPSAEAAEVLRRLFYHRLCDPRLAAQLFAGLARCAPRDYPLHAKRFLELRETVPSRFMYSGVALVRAIGAPTLIEALSELSPEHQHAFIELLGTVTRTHDSPITVTIAGRGQRVVSTQQPECQVFVAELPDHPTRHFAEHLENLRQRLPEGDINEQLRSLFGQETPT